MSNTDLENYISDHINQRAAELAVHMGHNTKTTDILNIVANKLSELKQQFDMIDQAKNSISQYELEVVISGKVINFLELQGAYKILRVLTNEINEVLDPSMQIKLDNMI